MPCRDVVEVEPGGDNGEPVLTPELFVTDESAEDAVGGRVIIFEVAAYPASHVADITFNYATSNGTGTAGVHYTATSGSATIPVGEATVQITVPVREPTSALGTVKTVILTISAPVNATITDATGTGTIRYDYETGTPDWEKASFTSCSSDKIPVYDQFRSYNNVTGPDHNDPDCTTADGAGCTGYAAALMMSILEFKNRKNARVGFRARKILTDSGFTVGGSTWYDYYVHQQLVSGRLGNPAGALTCDGVRRTLSAIREISEMKPSDGTVTVRYRDLKKRIKKRIVQNHCVYMSSSFYGGIWDTSGVEAYNYLRKPSSWSTTKGHSWILVGWNDAVSLRGLGQTGAWRLQSSHGKAWGDGGRAWLPYVHIAESYPGAGLARRRSGPNDPWFRFFYPVW